MKKKVIALVLTACMVPVVSVGSGVDVMAAKGDSGDKITLNWQSYDSYDKYQKVIEAFEKENPDIEINFEEVSDYATKILTEATAGVPVRILSTVIQGLPQHSSEMPGHYRNSM